MIYSSINFKGKFSKFDNQWSPRVIAEMNDYQFKLVKEALENREFLSKP
jgi:hypothetical protein